MARSVRTAQRSLESRASIPLTDSVILVDIHYHPSPGSPLILAETVVEEFPRYDALRRELWFLGVLVKKLRVSSENQETFLNCYEDQGWQRLLFDPLSPNGTTDPHKRFFDTVASLNKRHANPGWVAFQPDGGEKLYWVEGPQAIEHLALRHATPRARALSAVL